VSNLVEYMVEEHDYCNDLFCDSENLAAESKWTELKSSFEKYTLDLEKHFNKEEKVLFPRAEKKMGSQEGPTAVMRLEHEQMRVLVENLNRSIDEENKAGFLGETETLLVLMQQHNMKEEQILYPMLDRLLGDELEQVFSEMNMIS